jgi:GT2 family glycosyltransferase
VVVVDDASTDDSAEMVARDFPQVRLLRNPSNVHYATSNNRAFDVARGHTFLLLNNDTIVLPGAIDTLLAFLDQHPDVGAVGCKLLNEDGSIQASVKTLPSAMSALFGARSIITKLFPGNRFSRDHLLHLSRDMTGPFPAGYVSSAALLVRREVVRRVGYLDRRLSYHVDADYCRRIADAGWSIYYLPDATIIHLDHRGGTMVSRRRRFKSVVEFHRGSYIYYRKHEMRFVLEPLHLFVVAGLSARFAMSLLLQVAKELGAFRRISVARPAAATRTVASDGPYPGAMSR